MWKASFNIFFQGYNKNNITQQIQKADIPRESILHGKIKIESNRIPFSVTFSRTLPNVSTILNKHWNILHIDRKLKDLFSTAILTAYRRNKELRDFIGTNSIHDGKKVIRKNKHRHGPCYARAGNLCCNHIKDTNTQKWCDLKNIQHLPQR